jgi:hypothetical protein
VKVKLREQITGYRNEVAWPAVGEVVDLPDAEAAKLCAAGRATPVVEDRTEKAVKAEPAEKRTRTRTKSAD